MARYIWSNVDINIQTALAARQTITAISKADPGVVTHSGIDPTNGDIILLDVAGMREVHDRAFAVEAVNAAANTFAIGEDTSENRTFTSGGFRVVTLGVSMTNVQNINASGGEPEFADLTTVHDSIRKRSPTVVSPFNMEFDCFWDPSDPAMEQLGKASRTLTQRVVQIMFADGSYFVGSASIAAAGVPTGGAQDAVKTRVSFEFQGLPTTYGVIPV